MKYLTSTTRVVCNFDEKTNAFISCSNEENVRFKRAQKSEVLRFRPWRAANIDTNRVDMKSTQRTVPLKRCSSPTQRPVWKI